jgi:hypothetical protein
MKKILFAVIILLVAILMAVTVPDKHAHKEAMMKAIKEYVDEEAENRGFKNNLLTRLGKSVVNKTIEVVLDSKLKVDNYYLFNTTHVRMKEGNKTLSVGMFGHVFTFNKKMLREALEESAEEAKELKAEKKLEKQKLKEEKKKEKEKRKAEKRKKKEEKKRLKAEKKAAERKAKNSL